MPKKIAPTAKQKRNFTISAAVFVVASIIMLLTYDAGAEHWVYPWPAWIVAAWGLVVFGQYCLVFQNYEDPWLDTFEAMSDDINDK